MAHLLRDRGISFISTPFQGMVKARPTEHAHYGIEDGIAIVDRGHDLVRWNPGW